MLHIYIYDISRLRVKCLNSILFDALVTIKENTEHIEDKPTKKKYDRFPQRFTVQLRKIYKCLSFVHNVKMYATITDHKSNTQGDFFEGNS